MNWFSDPAAWSALAALLTLEVVLGVDNVIFISILASKLPENQQERVRRCSVTAFLMCAGLTERVEQASRHERIRVGDEIYVGAVGLVTCA